MNQGGALSLALLNEKSANNAWSDIIKKFKAAPEVLNYLEQCKLIKIEISQAAKAWEIILQCPYEPDKNTLDNLTKNWCRAFGDNFTYIFSFKKLESLGTLQEVCTNYWSEIISNLAKNMPACSRWLSDAELHCDGNKLEIKVFQELAFDYLHSRNVEKRIANTIKRQYNLETQVVISYDNMCADETKSSMDEYEKMEMLFREKINSINHKADKKTENKASNKAKAILGKDIKGESQAIINVIDEDNNVIVEGIIFDLEQRKLKTGRSLIIFNITDKTDSLACKIILDENKVNEVLEEVKDDKSYKIRGTVQFDRYTQELTMLVKDIIPAAVYVRKDNCEEKRVELHLHTKMSSLDATISAKDAIKRAITWGHKAIAITDHGVVQAFPEAFEASKGDIKIIYGVEGYLVNDEDLNRKGKVPTYHIIILAANQVGLRNLYELITISHLKYYHRVPRIPRGEIERLREGLIVGSACEAGELIRKYLKGVSDKELSEIASFYDYLEIQPRGNNSFLLEKGTLKNEEELLAMNKYIYDLGQKLNKPVVATGDVHFLDPEDEVYRRILMKGKGFEDADNQAPLYLKTTDEMLEEFNYLGIEAAKEIVIDNPVGIANKIEVLKPIPDELYPPEIEGAEDEIVQLTMTKAKSLYGEKIPEVVQKRIDKELNSIINNGFAVLYLIAHKLVKKSNIDGYLVGSRGSVGSSVVATFCDITEVNPLPPHYRCPHCKYSEFIKDGSFGSGADLPDKNCPHCERSMVKDGHDIPFEVFLGFKGDKVPDIDLNFSGDYQPVAHKYTEELFGEDNVFRAGTIATVAKKTAYGFVKSYYQEKNEFKRSAEINRLVNGCTGVKRTTGQHPGGVMVLPKGLDIHKFTPLQRPADDVKSHTTTTHFDYHSISSRLVKLDILGHDDPTVIKMLEDLTGVDCRSIPLDETKVLSLFKSTDALGIDAKELGSSMGTLGIPEFGTKFVRQMLEDTKPQTFSDLVRISGLSHGTDVWLHNAQDLVKQGVANVSEVISARDDIMIYLIYKGLDPSRAFKIMEGVRKGKGINEEDVEEMKKNGVPEWYIGSCQKIKYMFPKAHAVAYVMMAFRIAYFKVYYPAAFYASYFSVRADEFDADIIVDGIPSIRKRMDEISKKGNDATQKEEKLFSILEIALEMYLRGIHLKKVDINCSDSTRFLIMKDNNELLPPFISLQGLGQTAALSIVKARKKKEFISKEDLRIRAKLNKNVLDVLKNHGCLNHLPDNDQISLFS